MHHSGQRRSAGHKRMRAWHVQPLRRHAHRRWSVQRSLHAKQGTGVQGEGGQCEARAEGGGREFGARQQWKRKRRCRFRVLVNLRHSHVFIRDLALQFLTVSWGATFSLPVRAVSASLAHRRAVSAPLSNHVPLRRRAVLFAVFRWGTTYAARHGPRPRRNITHPTKQHHNTPRHATKRHAAPRRAAPPNATKHHRTQANATNTPRHAARHATPCRAPRRAARATHHTPHTTPPPHVSQDLMCRASVGWRTQQWLLVSHSRGVLGSTLTGAAAGCISSGLHISRPVSTKNQAENAYHQS